MTRDDLFWLAQRFLMLWLCYLALTHLWQNVGKGAVVVPALAAIALYFTSSQTASSGKAGKVRFTMTREDVLWVGCKLFGVYLLVLAVETLTSWVGFTISPPRHDMDFIWLPLAIVTGGLGYLLAFRDWVWERACQNHKG